MNLRRNEQDKRMHAIFIIDKSGSMESTRKETINGVNEQMQELRKNADKLDTKATLVLFSSADDIQTVFENTPIREVPDLTMDTYKPDGMTAMLDAVALTINRAKNSIEDTDNTTYLVVIVTDGEENASKEYSSHLGGYTKVANIIKECQNNKRWTITYLGANQDLSIINQQLGINTGNIALYNNSTSLGTERAFKGMTSRLASYTSARIGGTLETNAFYSTTGNPINLSEEPDSSSNT